MYESLFLDEAQMEADLSEEASLSDLACATFSGNRHRNYCLKVHHAAGRATAGLLCMDTVTGSGVGRYMTRRGQLCAFPLIGYDGHKTRISSNQSNEVHVIKLRRKYT